MANERLIRIAAQKILDDRADAFARCIRELSAARAEIELLRRALEPFAKAGELFAPDPRLDQMIYCPIAGREYYLTGSDLRRAYHAIHGGDANG